MKSLILITTMLSILAIADETPTYTTKDTREVHALGLKHTEQSERFKALKKSAARSLIRKSAGPIPKKVDLTPRVSPPENQGNCGSCWAFGITKALRSALMLAGKDPGTLAFNDLVHNCFPDHHQWGCNGGNFDAGESLLDGQGPGLESLNPYNESSRGACSKQVAGTALRYIAVGSGDTPSFKELAQALSEGHMLVVDVAVAGRWGSYSGGIYNGNGSGINHMINMNGYDCETSVDAQGNCAFDNRGEPVNGDGYLIVMNNWGTNWGENGYMRTRAHRNQIADTAMYYEVAEQPTPSPTPSPTPVPPPVPDGVKLPLWAWIVIGVSVLAGLAGLIFGLVKKP